MRFVEREALFHMDNAASVNVLKKGRSKDYWATTIVRAARVVEAGIGCNLFIDWERRHTSRESIIVDDLTHNPVHSLSDKELEAYLTQGTVTFPEPILQWMGKPGRDPMLRSRILKWLKQRFHMEKIKAK